jgi:hypothetical protein
VFPMVTAGMQCDGQFEAWAGPARRHIRGDGKLLRDPIGESGIDPVPLALIEGIERLLGAVRPQVILQVNELLLTADFDGDLKGAVR